MEPEKQHVSAIALWGFASGTANLSENDFEHILVCEECQWLVHEFTAVANSLPPVNPSAAA